MTVRGCGYCCEEYSLHFKKPCRVKARHEAAQLQRRVQELNLIDIGSEMDNLESYPPIRPIILSAIINGVRIQGPADTGASANFIKDTVVAENNFQARKSATPSYVHQPLSNAPVKLSDELFANVSIPAENFWNEHTSQLDKRLLSKDQRSVLALAVTAHRKPYRVPLHSSLSKKIIPPPRSIILHIHDPLQSLILL
jgi:hypothetical protein